MAPPPKAKLHKTTGRLKNINSSYTNSSSSGSSSNRSGNTNSSSSSNMPSSSESNQSAASENRINAAESTVIEQFEIELYWCIQTLENSLSAGKLNPKQVQDATKTLRSLKSSNQPMVKKRQLMQSAFGDYRKKMAEEEKKLRAGNTSIQFVDGSSKDAKTLANKSHFVKKSFTTTFGNSDFRFNFPIDDMQKLSIDQSNAAANDAPVSQGSAVSEPTSIKSHIDDDDKAIAENNTQHQNECANVDKLDASMNPFIKSKFHISDNNSFKFNFSIECD